MLGMVIDQGKLSNINGLVIFFQVLDDVILNVGIIIFCLLYILILFGLIVGEVCDVSFQLIQKILMYDWYDVNGVDWELVGYWWCFYVFVCSGEIVYDVVNCEIVNVCQNVGMFDVLIFGKILVKGLDVGKFFDMFYINMMSILLVGKCCYGLMCNENGFFMDDGVVVCFSEDSWLCYIIIGGVFCIYVWMEDWLQCEWWDWNVYIVNLIE